MLMLFVRFAQTSAAVLLAGTVVLRLLAGRTDVGETVRVYWNRLAGGSWCVLVAAGTLQLWLTAAAMSGLPLAQALSAEVLGRVLGGTRFGAVWLAREALLAAMLVVMLVPSEKRREGQRRQRRQRRWTAVAWELAGAGLCAGLLASLVWSGHAHASGGRASLLPVNVLHVLAAGAWPGGLVPLLVLLARARRGPEWVPAAVTVTRRFSRLSVAAVAVLALSGLLNARGLVGTLAALGSSGYGCWLLCKVALFAGMLGLGAMNRRLAAREEGEDAAETIRRLWRNVAWECVLAVWVLLATAALAQSAPPTSAG